MHDAAVAFKRFREKHTWNSIGFKSQTKYKKALQIPIDIDFDTFNSKFNDFTRRQYIEFINCKCKK
jgi:hypothetical protein